ncbi:hypothetical protein KVR01_012787 [Diaporthe batatas]|uniref:uncharacterized protein n=1 Tax=Diaporthe batatas TaxID=748121 RepID=UPI001D0368A4|nr:uncharacterized protein KVR01_012787 [Diaporthe batatas]KAG8157403.1 hypothetical protein KVR01_012787 [Diaporthe batatas]
MMATREASGHGLDNRHHAAAAVGTVWMAPDTGVGSMQVGAPVPVVAVALPHHPGPAPAAPAQRRGRSDATWEAHRPVIKALYLDQGRSLKEVMEIMRSSYGLEASPKLFKARIKRWGFSKYITNKLEREALQHVVSRSGSLQREGAPAHEMVRLSNGAMISLSSLINHLDRKRSAASSSSSSSSSSSPTSICRPLRPPDGLWISEEMLVNAREYTLREYTARCSGDEDVRAILPLHFGDLCRGFVATRRLLQEARIEDALLVLRRAPDQIRSSLFGPASSNAFGCVCMTVLCVRWEDDSGSGGGSPGGGAMNATLRALLKYAASLLHEGAGPEPLRRVLLRLAEVDDAVFRAAMVQAWRCELDTWTAMMEPGCWNIPLLGEWLAFADAAGSFDQLPPGLGQGLEDTIRSHEAQYGRGSLPVVTLLWFQAEYERLLAENRGTSTERPQRMFRELLGRGPELDLLIRYAAQYFLAKEYRVAGDRHNAERFLREAIDSLCALEDRPGHGMSAVLEMMFDLECWFTEWGEHDKARDTRQWRLDMCLAQKRRSP